MDQEEYQKQAVELADILLEEFKSNRYSETCTLWSASFLWDGVSVGKYDAANPYAGFIPATFERSGKKPEKPLILLPKATSEAAHYSALAMSNRDVVEGLFLDALQAAQYPSSSLEQVRGVISDSLLSEEVAERYVVLKDQGNIESADIVSFLVHYDVQKQRYNERMYEGTFVHLATRLLHRYGDEGMVEGMFSLLRPDLAEAARKHHDVASVPCDLTIDDALAEVYSTHVPSNGVSLAKPKKAKRIVIPGRKKVKVSEHSIATNWKQVQEAWRQTVQGYKAFEPNEVVMARLVREKTTKYLNMYIGTQGNLDTVKAAMRAEIESERKPANQAVVKEVLDKVFYKLELIRRFDDFDIHHEMPVTIVSEKTK